MHDRNQNESRSRATRLRFFAAAVALTCVFGGTGVLLAQDDSDANSPDRAMGSKGAQVAALYELQAAFHRASTVRDPVNGDSDDAIRQRVRALLSLWTQNGWLFFNVGSPRDGYYIGNGDPSSPSTCPARRAISETGERSARSSNTSRRPFNLPTSSSHSLRPIKPKFIPTAPTQRCTSSATFST